MTSYSHQYDDFSFNEDTLDDDISWAITTQHYSLVKKLLSHNTFDPNSEIDFGYMYMTALEFAAITCDWKLAIIFFLHGADPSVQCCDGSIRVVNSTPDHKGLIHPCFKNMETKRLVGFDRLMELVPKPIDDCPKTFIESNTMQTFIQLMAIANGDIDCSTKRNMQLLHKVFNDVLEQLKRVCSVTTRDNDRHTHICLRYIDSLVNQLQMADFENNRGHGQKDDCFLHEIVMFTLKYFSQ